MWATTSCACSGVAVRPVPIAQTGSYAITQSSTDGGLSTSAKTASSWRSTTSKVLPASRSSLVSPTARITSSPCASDGDELLPDLVVALAEDVTALGVTDEREVAPARRASPVRSRR